MPPAFPPRSAAEVGERGERSAPPSPALTAQRRRTEGALTIFRLLGMAIMALSALTSSRAGVDRGVVAAIDLGVAVSAMPMWFVVRRAADARQIQRVAALCTAADLAAYGAILVLAPDIAGGAGVLGLLVLIEAPLRAGWVGAGFGAAGVGAVALAFPPVQSDGTTQNPASTVLMCIGIAVTVAILSGYQRRAAARFRNADELFRASFAQASNGLALVGADGVILLSNRALDDLAHRAGAFVVRRQPRTLQDVPIAGLLRVGLNAGPDEPILEPDGALSGAPVTALFHNEGAESFSEVLGDVVLGRRAGLRDELRLGQRTVVVSATPVGEPLRGGRMVLLQVDDVTEQRRIQADLAHRATHDDLTLLPNRSLVAERLRYELRAGRPLAVLFIDLDRFKDVNDERGHAAGDEVLRVTAERLRRTVRPGDLVGRLSGDEFLIVCPGVTIDRLSELGRRVEQVLCEPIVIDQHGATVAVSASVGAHLPTGDEDADTVIARADHAMYANKRRRRSGRAIAS